MGGGEIDTAYRERGGGGFWGRVLQEEWNTLQYYDHKRYKIKNKKNLMSYSALFRDDNNLDELT